MKVRGIQKQGEIDKANPLSQESLNYIFKVSAKKADCIISRESSILEFKESFGWKSLPKYLKTCAAFANAKGGYVVFGVTNRPHRLVGLSGASLASFEGINPEIMTEHFNNHFSPEISWNIQEYELDGKTYGLLHVEESKSKPVVCIKDAEKELREGDIYYRYRGRSERIKYPELRAILDLRREKEQRLWMQHLLRIAKIGVRDAGIFSLHTGVVTGAHGSFIIDESLLSQLSFIKEGVFSEVKGKPTLKLIGNLEPISTIQTPISRKQIVKTKGIRISDIVLAFLKQEKVEEPLEYIKQICFENTAYLPIYYFMNLSGVDKANVKDIIENTLSRSPAKAKLLGRLQQGITQKMPLPNNESDPSKKKRQFISQIKNKKVDKSLDGKDLDYCLQAIRILTVREIIRYFPYLSDLLKTWFNQHYSSADGTIAANLRRAICWLDEAHYMVPQKDEQLDSKE